MRKRLNQVQEKQRYLYQTRLGTRISSYNYRRYEKMMSTRNFKFLSSYLFR